MTQSSQRRAVERHRQRLRDQGLSRFEVRGLATDKELIRSLARRLAGSDEQAQQLRAEVIRSVGGEVSSKGRIFAALRRSPLVGSELDLQRDRTGGRDIDL